MAPSLPAQRLIDSFDSDSFDHNRLWFIFNTSSSDQRFQMPAKSRRTVKAKSKDDSAAATSADSSNAPPAPATPNRDAFFDRLESVERRCNALGHLFIEGVESDDEDAGDADEDDEGETGHSKNEPKDYSIEQLAKVRLIVVTPARKKALNQAARFATCGQENDGIMMFNTHSGNMIVEGIPIEINKIMRKKSFSAKFDAFFALIFQLNRHDFWMTDNELYGPGGELNDAVKKLGNAAKKIMARTDEELGIDAEFTRPGMIKLLENFQKTLASYDHMNLEEHFVWQ